MKTFLFFISLLSFFEICGQSMNFEAIDAGPYGRGSSIAVLFNPKGTFPVTNDFELWLSDTDGNFSGAEQKIGNYNSFYTTFINGIIPLTAIASDNYRVQIRAVSGTITSTSPYTISVKTDPGTSGDFISLNGLGNPIAGKWLWVVCKGDLSAVTIQSNLGSSISGTAKNEFDTIPAFSSDNRNYFINGNSTTDLAALKTFHYRLFNKTESVIGIISTQAWFLVNNKTVGPFSSVLTTVCYSLSQPGNFQFKIDIDKGVVQPYSAYYNFPGYVYEANWDDNTPNSQYSIQQIVASGGLISHQYSKSSCGETINNNGTTFFNSIGPSLKVNNFNPPCLNTVNSISPIQVFQKPEIKFSVPPQACQGSLVNFNNESILGSQGTTDVNQCKPPAITYQWIIDGKIAATTFNYSTTTLSLGNHTIILNPVFNQNEINCPPSPDTQHICIQPLAAPAFTVNGGDSVVSCAPETVKTNNTTITGICDAPAFSWQVIDEVTGEIISPAAGVYTVIGGLNDKNPTFIFNLAGRYLLELTSNNSCGTNSLSKKIIMLGTTGVSFPHDTSYCGLKTIDFKTDPNHKPFYNSSGGANEKYSWTITGGSYNLLGNTTLSSAYPLIQFNDLTIYEVSVVFTNNCGTKQASHKIQFFSLISSNAGNDTTVCFNTGSLPISAKSTGNAGRWGIIKGFGKIGDINQATTDYTFGGSDIANRSVILAYTVSAPAGSPCDTVSDQKVISILDDNIIISKAIDTICTGNKLSYTPQSTIAGSTFSWTSKVTRGSVNIIPGTSATVIDDVLNNGSSTISEVVYTMVATDNNCVGSPLFLTVSVYPTLTITAVTQHNPETCGAPVGSLTLSGLIPNTIYSINYSKDGSVQTVNPSPSSDVNGTLTISGLTAGIYSNISAKTQQGGCLSNVMNGPYIITDPTPPAQPITPDSILLCSGDTLILSVTAPQAGITYTWKDPNGNILSPPTITNVSVLNSGMYNVTAKLNGCISSPGITKVIINQTPSTPVVSSNTPLCMGGTINLQSGINPGNGATYAWTGPNNFSSSDKNPTIPNANTSMSGDYKVVATSIQGNCISATGTGKVVVNPVPDITNVAFSNPATCNSATGAITLSGLQLNSSFNVSYKKNNTLQTGIFGSNGNGSLVVNPLSAGIYTDVSVDLNGCSSNVKQGPYILADPDPPSMPVATNTSPLCSGSTLSFSANTLSTGNVVYQWTGPGFVSPVTGSSQAIFNANVSDSGIYSVTATLNGCVSAPGTTHVIINQTPVITSATANSPICSDSTINLSVTSSVSDVTFAWTGPASFTSILQNPVITNATAANAGNYVVNVISVTGSCSSAPAQITVLVLPTPVITNVASVNPVNCNTATGYLEISGLIASTEYAVHYSKDGLAGTIIPNPVSDANGKLKVSGLFTGIYSNISVEVKSSGCSSNVMPGPYILTDPNPPLISGNNFTNPVQCGGANGTIILHGLLPGIIYNVSYTKGISNITLKYSADANGDITITGLSADTYNNVSVELNNCRSNFIAGPINLTDPDPPSAPVADSLLFYCEGAVSSALTATAITGNSLKWYDANLIPLSSAPVPATSSAGTLRYYVSQVNNFTNCEGQKAPISVIINPIPMAPVVSTPVTYCQNEPSVPLTAIASAGDVLNWYDSNLVVLPSAPIPITTTPHSTKFYVSESNNYKCESHKALITVEINPTPKIVTSGYTNPVTCGTPSGFIFLNVHDLNDNPISNTTFSVHYEKFQTLYEIPARTDISGKIIIPLVAGTYSNIYVESAGCVSLKIPDIFVLKDPGPPAKPIAGYNFPLCSETQLNLSASSPTSSQTAPIDYVWVGPAFGPFADTSRRTVVSFPSANVSYSGTYIVYAIQNNCISTETSFQVDIKRSPSKPLITTRTPLCIGDHLTLQAFSSIPGPNTALNYSWTGPGTGFPVNLPNAEINNVKIQDGGIYTITVTSSGTGCSSTSDTFILIGGKPVIKFSQDSVTLPTGYLLTLAPVITNAGDPNILPIKSYEWSPLQNLTCDNLLCSLPVATVKNDICYTVKATNIYGCSGSDVICVKVFCEKSQVIVPNAFTPSGNLAENRKLMVRATGISSVKSFRIFNRYGQIVFEKNNFPPNASDFGWDGRIRGKLADRGVYIYTTEVVCENGAVFSFHGDITLL